MTNELDALIEHVPLPAYVFRVTGEDFVLVAVSAVGLARNPGLTELLGHPMQRLYRDQPQAVADAARCVSENTPVIRDATMRRYDRTEATQQLRLTYVPLPPDRLVIFAEDRPTPEVAEVALRESEARYRSLIMSMPDAVLVRGADGRILACNDVAVRLFGARSQVELLGTESAITPAYRVFTEGGAPVSTDEFPSRRVLSTGRAEIGQSYVLLSAGTSRFIRVSAGPIHSADGKVKGSVTIFTDVTQQRHLEEELRRAHRLESIGRLAGGVAHDFNNLLAAMMGSIELLSRNVPAAGKEDLETILHGATRARDLTRQLLAFARKQPVEFKVIDLSATVSNVERILRRLVGPEIELVIASGGPVSVRADPSLLEQVLVNLVVNAKDAMPDGGRLTVRVRRMTAAEAAESPGDFAVLEVSDSGVGMDEETQSKVFDPFFTTKESGTGLGLASSYGIVKEHGGEILVDSRPGQGTRFRVLLPRLDEAPFREAPPREAPVATKTGCILVVDDDDLVRAATVRMVTSLGYTALSARTAEAAVALARTHPGPIQCLLCDVSMPGPGGPAVAREIQALRPGILVIFASGYAEGATPEGAAFLQKPYGLAELAEKLTKLRSLQTAQ